MVYKIVYSELYSLVLKGSSIKNDNFISSQKAQQFMLKTTFKLFVKIFFCIYTRIVAKI